MSDPQPKPRQPKRTRAQEEAAEWLARLGNHSITTKTVREFRDWRDDPANDAAYEEAEAFWEASGRHAADPEITRMTQEALDRGKRRAGGWRAWLRGPRLAGTLTLASIAAIGGGYLVVQQLTPTYGTRDIEQKVVRLEDGSRVHLNVESQVKVAFRDGERRLTLTRGEAYFDVAHDARRPFIVEVDGAQVRALGTKFDVRRRNGGVQVTLVQGSVRVSPDAGQGGPVVLRPNQQAMLSRGAAIRTAAIDATRTTSWTTGRLVFRDTPLAAAVAEVNRYSGQKVELVGAGLEARPVSGFFDVGDAESFARGMAELLELGLTRGPGGAWRLAPGAQNTSTAGV
jgi:transmembrane sensor